MEDKQDKQDRQAGIKKKSLPVKIGIFYTILALINILFFSIMTLENQTDLLFINFKYQAEELVKAVLGPLSKAKITVKEDVEYKKLENTLKQADVSSFIIFTEAGKPWHYYSQEDQNAVNPKTVSKELLVKTSDLNNRSSLFQSRYLIELNEDDYSLDVLLPLKKSTSTLFLSARLSIRTIQDRVTGLYYQAFGSAVWGIVFHILFAIFVFRLIFRRVEILRLTSNKMADGELSVRADWKKNAKKGYDELDLLGESFNSMAQNIQSKVETISLLNQQIQEELSIGKDVQELFLTPSSVIEKLKPAIFFRPLRKVSGDIYRYFKFKGGYYGVFFADASGHGVSAALITVITLLALEETISKKTSPKKLMEELNRILAIRLDTSYYSTSVFLLFHPDGRLFGTNCGHNTVFILPASSEEIIEIKSDGPPLGLIEDSKYAFNEFSLKKGDKIIVYSDGLIETEDGNKEQYGLDRFFKCLEGMRSEENDKIREVIEEDFTKFSRHYIDDVSLMVLEMP